jgi:hypothetical protein
MSCQAILTNNLGVLAKEACCNHSMDGSLFCEEHQTITMEEHKMRWMRKFLFGSDGKPFLYHYDESKKERILGDLEKKSIELTPNDINLMATRSNSLDIYVLLFEHGYISLEKNHNHPLYLKAIGYLFEFWFLGKIVPVTSLPRLARKIWSTFILKDAKHMRYFLYNLDSLMNHYTLQGRLESRFLYIEIFLTELLTTPALSKLSWEPFENDILQHYEARIGKEHLLTKYFQSTYLPRCKEMYRAEKKLQKDRIDSLKEELMMITWHPDRFLTWCLDEEEKEENRQLFA